MFVKEEQQRSICRAGVQEQEWGPGGRSLLYCWKRKIRPTLENRGEREEGKQEMQEPQCVIRSRTESRSPPGMVVVSGCKGVKLLFHLLGHEGTQSSMPAGRLWLSGCRSYSIGLATSHDLQRMAVNLTLSEKCLGT